MNQNDQPDEGKNQQKKQILTDHKARELACLFVTRMENGEEEYLEKEAIELNSMFQVKKMKMKDELKVKAQEVISTTPLQKVIKGIKNYHCLNIDCVLVMLLCQAKRYTKPCFNLFQIVLEAIELLSDDGENTFSYQKFPYLLLQVGTFWINGLLSPHFNYQIRKIWEQECELEQDLRKQIKDENA